VPGLAPVLCLAPDDCRRTGYRFWPVSASPALCAFAPAWHHLPWKHATPPQLGILLVCAWLACLAAAPRAERIPTNSTPSSSKPLFTHPSLPTPLPPRHRSDAIRAAIRAPTAAGARVIGDGIDAAAADVGLSRKAFENAIDYDADFAFE